MIMIIFRMIGAMCIRIYTFCVKNYSYNYENMIIVNSRVIPNVMYISNEFSAIMVIEMESVKYN